MDLDNMDYTSDGDNYDMWMELNDTTLANPPIFTTQLTSIDTTSIDTTSIDTTSIDTTLCLSTNQRRLKFVNKRIIELDQKISGNTRIVERQLLEEFIKERNSLEEKLTTTIHNNT